MICEKKKIGSKPCMIELPEGEKKRYRWFLHLWMIREFFRREISLLKNFILIFYRENRKKKFVEKKPWESFFWIGKKSEVIFQRFRWQWQDFQIKREKEKGKKGSSQKEETFTIDKERLILLQENKLPIFRLSFLCWTIIYKLHRATARTTRENRKFNNFHNFHKIFTDLSCWLKSS